MPKIQIDQVDYTKGGLNFVNNNTVYIPGPTLFDTEASAYYPGTKPVLCASLQDLTDAATANHYDKDSLSFKLAKYVINNLHAYVYYEGINLVITSNSRTVTGEVKLVSKTLVSETWNPDPEGNTTEKSETYNCRYERIDHELTVVTQTVPETSWERLKDKTIYDLRFLTTGGLANDTQDIAKKIILTSQQLVKTTYEYDSSTETVGEIIAGPELISETAREQQGDPEQISKKIIKDNVGYVDANEVACASARKDCVALVELPSELLIEGTDVVAALRTAVSGVTASGEFAAAFAPAFTSNIPGFEDVKIPACFGYLFAYFNSIQNNPEWYAAAGSERGIIPGLVAPLYEFSNTECERLQARAANTEVDLDAEGDNVGFAINPIAYVRPYGYVIWGNRTLLLNDGSLKATSFLNVRQLVTTLVKRIFDTARRFTFSPNTNVLWVNFTSQITPLLDRMRSGNGILGYRLVKEKTDAKARLKAKVIIVPVEAVEDFEIEVALTDDLDSISINE